MANYYYDKYTTRFQYEVRWKEDPSSYVNTLFSGPERFTNGFLLNTATGKLTNTQPIRGDYMAGGTYIWYIGGGIDGGNWKYNEDSGESYFIKDGSWVEVPANNITKITLTIVSGYDKLPTSYVKEVSVVENKVVKDIIVSSNLIYTGGIYPDNGIHTDGYWYIKKGSVDPAQDYYYDRYNSKTQYEHDTYSQTGAFWSYMPISIGSAYDIMVTGQFSKWGSTGVVMNPTTGNFTINPPENVYFNASNTSGVSSATLYTKRDDTSYYGDYIDWYNVWTGSNDTHWRSVRTTYKKGIYHGIKGAFKNKQFLNFKEKTISSSYKLSATDTIGCSSFTDWYEETGITRKFKDLLINVDVIAKDLVYPDNGIHTDGYWYIKKGTVFPSFKMAIEGTLKTSSDGWVNVDGALRKVDSMWTNTNGILKKI